MLYTGDHLVFLSTSLPLNGPYGGQFEWSDGSPYGYSYWDRSQPGDGIQKTEQM